MHWDCNRAIGPCAQSFRLDDGQRARRAAHGATGRWPAPVPEWMGNRAREICSLSTDGPGTFAGRHEFTDKRQAASFVLLGHFRLEIERSRRLLNLAVPWAQPSRVTSDCPGSRRPVHPLGASKGRRRLSRLLVSARTDRDLLLLKN